MAVTRAELRYNISDWQQLSQCLSNISNEYHIRTKRAIGTRLNSNKLNGTIIEVYHDRMGTLFTYLIEAEGDLVTGRKNNSLDMSVSQLLDELSRFGFIITFNRKAYLSEDQLSYLKTLKGLNFDKIRWMYVYSYNVAGEKISVPHIVAFSVAKLSTWLDNSYTCDSAEFESALTHGHAINLDEISNTHQYRWDWLDYVASIDDILAENNVSSDTSNTYTKDEIDAKLKSMNDMLYTMNAKTDSIVQKADEGGFDGFSPTIDVDESESGKHRLTITDKYNTETVDIRDGEKGDSYTLTEQDKDDIASKLEDKAGFYISEV